ncbi:hypothetical protein IMG5_117370, partial [Ichthyophthirius multifiliis]
FTLVIHYRIYRNSHQQLLTMNIFSLQISLLLTLHFRILHLQILNQGKHVNFIFEYILYMDHYKLSYVYFVKYLIYKNGLIYSIHIINYHKIQLYSFNNNINLFLFTILIKLRIKNLLFYKIMGMGCYFIFLNFMICSISRKLINNLLLCFMLFRIIKINGIFYLLFFLYQISLF